MIILGIARKPYVSEIETHFAKFKILNINSCHCDCETRSLPNELNRVAANLSLYRPVISLYLDGFTAQGPNSEHVFFIRNLIYHTKLNKVIGVVIP
nr:hypothetical protein [Buzura suppressaria nucleopolyhedrovirus]